VFGSWVRDDATSASDLDVPVELARPVALSSFLALEARLAAITGLRVDPVSTAALKPQIGERVRAETIACDDLSAPASNAAPDLSLRLTTESAGEVAIRSPVMPTQVGIHVCPCREQQDMDGVARSPGHEPRHDGVGVDRAAREAIIPRWILTQRGLHRRQRQ
jgi:predicted nucleotidyltransferase